MSYQTKNESIGYILKSVLNSDLPANMLLEVGKRAKKLIPERNDIENDDTLDYAAAVFKELGVDPKKIEELKSEIYYLFDIKTVEEAGEVFDAFSSLFPVLRN